MKVTYIDHMGTDLSVVNAAKVSFGKRSEWMHKVSTEEKVLSKQDQGLIQFLARGCTSGAWEKQVVHDQAATWRSKCWHLLG